MKNLFGLLPDPDEAYDNAPQLELDTNLLNSIRKDLTGLSGVQESNMRSDVYRQVDRSNNNAQRQIRAGGANQATAIAQSNALDKKSSQAMVDGEQMIQKRDLAMEQNAEKRFNQEYRRLDDMENQNKLARETAREEAKLARKQIAGSIVGSVGGMALDQLFNPSKGLQDMFGGDEGETPNPEVQTDDDFQRPDVDWNANEPATPTAVDQMYQGSYTVQEGDTLADIASRYGTSVQELSELNFLDDPNALEIGQELNIFDPTAKSTIPAITDLRP